MKVMQSLQIFITNTPHSVRSSCKYFLVVSSVGFIFWSVLTKALSLYLRRTQLNRKKTRISTNVEKIRQHLANLPKQVDTVLLYVDKDLSEICEEIQKDNVTPVELLHAFQAKALELFDDGNSGIADFIGEAEEHAISLEKLENKKLRSPLHGIPVSIKETCSVSGYDCTAGVIKLCNQACRRNSVIVKALKKAGAVPFVTTVTSQLCSSLDGFNPVYGEVSHPFVKSRLPGGSSSGEGVLLALHGSPIGIGTDLAGSIRIPAAFCGLAGLKPSTVRLSISGIVPSSSVIFLRSCVGPMGRKVEDLVRVMRTLLSPAMFNLDSYVIPMSFDEEMYSGTCKHNLVIGYYTSLTDPNIIPVLKVNQMAVKKAVTALKKIGHRVVEFTVPHPYQAYILGLRALFADGGETIRKQLYGEPVGPHLYFLNLLLRFPNFLRPLADIVSRLAYGKPSAIAHATQKLKTGREAIDLITEINTYRYGFFKAWSDAGPLDALICPATPYPAPPKDVSSVYVTPSIAYTILYNLLDCPAGTVPVGSVTKIDIQESLKMAQSFSFEGNKYASKVFSLLEGAEGLPLAVQVVGKPYHEEIVLRVMRELEEHVDKVVL